MQETIPLTPWKGEGTLSIINQIDAYKVVEYRKEKETGKSGEISHIIPKQNVDVLWKLIRDNCVMDLDYSYRYIVRLLQQHYQWQVDIEAFNGGRNRALYYFPYFYYPLKILESQGLIYYYGRGGIRLV